MKFSKKREDLFDLKPVFYFQVQFSKDSYVESKKRTRKLSDEPYALIDVGDTPKSPPLDQCVETEARNLTIYEIMIHISFEF